MTDSLIEPGRHADPFPPLLTTSLAKASLYSVDTYFVEAWTDMTAALGDPTGFAWDHGVLVLRPDAFAGRTAHRILRWLDESGFEITQARRFRYDRHSIRAEWRYQWNIATHARKVLSDVLLTASDSMLIVVRDRSGSELPATVRLTDLKGPAVVANRRPHHLRSQLGLPSAILSFLHTADEPADVVREFGVHTASHARIATLTRLQERPNAAAAAWALCDEIYGEVPARNFELAALGERLVTSTPTAGDEPDRQELHRVGSELSVGRTVSWPFVPALVRRCGLRFDLWDEIVLRAGHIEASHPHLQSVLKTEPDDWRNVDRAGMSASTSTLNAG